MKNLKKFITLPFLMFAGIIMLVFTIVPHHHHQAYICFNYAHCENEQNSHTHSHDGEDADDEHNCIRDLLQTQVSRVLSLSESDDEGLDTSHLQTFFLASHCLSVPDLKWNACTHSITPYQEDIRLLCPISTQADRAPPIV